MGASSHSVTAPCNTGILGGTYCTTTTDAGTYCTTTTNAGTDNTAILCSGFLYSHLDSRLTIQLQVVDSSTRHLSRKISAGSTFNPSKKLWVIVLFLFLLTWFLAQCPKSLLQLTRSPPIVPPWFSPLALKISWSNNLKVDGGGGDGCQKI